jgi:hypothetical protein
MVSGTCAIGSPGASSSSRKIIRLMNRSVGIASNNRRIVKVSMGDASVQQRGSSLMAERKRAGPALAGPAVFHLT